MFIKYLSFRTIVVICFAVLSIFSMFYTEMAISGDSNGKAESKETYIILENGMDFVLIENHSNPMIASVVVVKTGSKNENLGSNGVSHMLEHLLFNGTENRTQQELYDEMDFYGGYNNAHTAKDFTNFMILMPSEHIDKGLDVQADMLFNSTIPAEKLEKERGIVIEEIGKDMDHEGYLNRQFFERKLYRNTSYGLPILGTVNTIKFLKREEIFSYYKQHYVPNNMTGLIIGGFETEEMVEKLKKYFGVYPPGKVPVVDKNSINLFEKNETFHGIDSVTKKHLSIGIKAPTLNDSDFFAFKILNSYLNNSGYLTFGNNHAEKEKTDINTNGLRPIHAYSEYASNCNLGVLNVFTALPVDANADEAIKVIVQKLKDIAGKIDITESELKGIKTQLKTEEFFLKERMHYYGMSKAHILANMDFSFFESYVEGFENVTIKDMKRVAEKYLSIGAARFFRRTGKSETVNYVATIVEPLKVNDNKSLIAGYHDSANVDSENVIDETSEQPKGITKKEVLPNGLTLIINENKDSRVFAVHVLFKNRSFHEPEDKTGIADFVHRMVLKGTITKDEKELENAFDSLGARLSLYDDPYIPYDDYRTSTQYSFMRLETIDDFYEKSLELFADVIINPQFATEKIDEVKRGMLDILQSENKSVYKTAKKLFRESMFTDTTLAQRVSGTIKTVSSIHRDDLVAFHKKYFAPNNMIINIVGNIPNKIISKKINDLFGGVEKNNELKTPEPKLLKTVSGGKPVKVKKNKKQSYIYLGYTIPSVEEKDEAPIVILSSVLSNDMAYRLREQQGLAYSLSCSIFTMDNFGWLQSSMGTRQKNIEQAKNGILEIVGEYRTKDFDKNEVEKSVNKLRGKMMMRRLPRINQAYYSGVYEFYKGDYEYDKKFLSKLNSVTPADLKRVAQRYLQNENYLLVVVE